VEGAGSLLFLALFVLAFWFLVLRPQRRRQHQLMELQRSVQIGDRVMLSAGVFARGTGELDDPAAGDCLLVEVAPGVEIEIARGAVMRVINPPVETSLDENPGTAVEPTDENRDG
jgi:preprotein translocase subunit YajC